MPSTNTRTGIPTRLRSNILITGGEHAERVHEAYNIAKTLLCTHQQPLPCGSCLNCRRVTSGTHPNLIWVSPQSNDKEGKESIHDDDTQGSIKVEQVRQIVLEHQKSSFEDGVSIFVISHMHRATTAAANALLKVMEENHPTKLFIALAPSRSAVLKTIASRLKVLPIKPKLLNQLPHDHKRELFIQKICSLPKKDRFDDCAQFGSDREAVLAELTELIKTCHIMLRKNMLAHHVALGILDGIAQAQRELLKNLNTKLVVEQLFFVLWPHASS